MKKNLFGVLFAAALVVAVSAPLAAQSTNLAANVPFEFSVAGKTLPAGEYIIQNAGDGSVILIRGAEGGPGAVVLTHGDRTSGMEPGKAFVTFNRYNDTYFLSSIWNGFSGSARSVAVTKAEAELSRTASVQKFEVAGYLARR